MSELTKRLRVEQRKNEPADIFAMRAFVKAAEFMKPQEASAAIHWLLSAHQARALLEAHD